jgi:hypothetical protein
VMNYEPVERHPVVSGVDGATGRLSFLLAHRRVRLPGTRRSEQFPRLRHFTASVPWSALCTKSAKDQFAFADNTFTDGFRSGPGHVVPLEVLDIAAAVADKVVMPHAFGIEACGPAFDGYFSHQSRLDQVAQIVIGCGSRGARIHPIHGFEDFRSRWVALAFHQECHQGVALWRTPQPAAVQRPSNRIGIHVLLWNKSNLIFCQGRTESWPEHFFGSLLRSVFSNGFYVTAATGRNVLLLRYTRHASR